jgi:hypothetical protein
MLAMIVNGTAGIRTARVIVNDHRERARSYRGFCVLRLLYQHPVLQQAALRPVGREPNGYRAAVWWG